MLDWNYVTEWRIIDAIEKKKRIRKAKALRKRKIVNNVIGVLVVWALIVLLAINWDCLYITEAVVTETTEDEVFVEIENEIYSYYGDGKAVGDSVVLLMSNNGTELNKIDDIIITKWR